MRGCVVCARARPVLGGGGGEDRELACSGSNHGIAQLCQLQYRSLCKFDSAFL